MHIVELQIDAETSLYLPNGGALDQPHVGGPYCIRSGC